MTRLYSKTTGCCYLEGVHRLIPADAVEISDEIYGLVIGSPPPGKIRSHDENGLPILIDPPAATLDQVKASQVASLATSCAAQIVGGFYSSALADGYRYPSAATDQSNLTASVLASVLATDAAWVTPLWCEDAAGVGAYRDHTAAQAQAVGSASLAARNQALEKKAALEAQVNAASTTEEVVAITW